MLLGKYSKNKSKLTFPVITVLAEYILRSNPKLLRALRITYSHIFLDEFQDTTAANYALIKTSFMNSSCSITAVGDEKQRIMLWAGAYRGVFSDFERDFTTSKKILVTNFRSAPRLITLQRHIAAYMGKDGVEVQPSSKWKNEDGICEVYLFNSPEQEAEVIAQKVADFIEIEKLKPHDFCFLVRQKPPDYSKHLINKLSLLDLKARNENEYQDLLSEEINLFIIELILVSVGKRAPDAYRNCADLLSLLRGIGGNLDFEEKHQEIDSELSSLRSCIREWLSQANNQETLERIINRIVDQIGRSTIQLIFPQYKNEEYLKSLISKVSTFVWNEYQISHDWEEAVQSLKGEKSIPIMTIHKSKGLEYNTVIFVGLEDNAFWNYTNQAEEETSNFFVALSRAKQRLIFTFTQERNARPNTWKKIQSLYSMLGDSKVVELFDYRNTFAKI